ncbi:serine/threonine protein kinase related protein [Lentisphaera araneosa HTCC2155]|uniref:Serine/threonine protein kinase related protein n=1 Tax=Lentisphaera araneosa HTCC2155 TaxID=313628 RepID=A6DJP4_9BACT|nr:PQQ-binding-like beta-propeller repeat protein [Lentisphaera araneosa]EDM28118.1 serine/threonine protein kinase related protein [Lentisphaera araneosa HTCC2155]
MNLRKYLPLLMLSQLTWAGQLPEIPEDSGGLLLYVGKAPQDEVKQLASIVSSPRLIGQILIKDGADLKPSREQVAEQKTKGQLSVQTYNGSDIPVISSVANIILCAESAKIDQDEIMRALTPRGIAYIQKGEQWQKIVKPVPSDIDDWTHALYNPANTVVSKDTKVGPPRRLQWMTGPGWSRSHEHMVSFNAMVSEGGIVYYIVDMGSRSAVALPARWTLIARDGFNGKELWRKELPSWMNHMWPLKSGPTQIQRKLVAVDGKVYVTLGALAPVSQLDGRTGKVLKTYEGTENVDEIILDNDQLIVHMSDHVKRREGYTHDMSHVWAAAGNARQRFAWTNEERTIVSINPETGKTSWVYKAPCIAMTMNMDKDKIYFFDGANAQAISRKDGKLIWKSDKLVLEDLIKAGELGAGYAPTMLNYMDMVIIQIRESRKPAVVFGIDSKTGKTMWTQKPQHSGHHSPEDLIPIRGLLWTGGTYAVGKGGGTYQGINPKTGKIEKEFPLDVDPDYWFHQRCYRAKATEKYIMPAATGTEYIDTEKGTWNLNHWVRGGCLYGVMPANGVTYVPPNPCACYSESQLRTLGAFAPAEEGVDYAAIVKENRFFKGPAYDQIEELQASNEDWPMYRKSVERTAATKSTIPSTIQEKWRVAFEGAISAPVSAHGLALVSLLDAQQVVAIDQKIGKVKWRYNTGAKVNSAPTIYRGRVLFGASDGWVTCLRLSDGELAWRYRASPQNKQLIADEQVESVWPLVGSVLIHQDRLYAVAGRSLFVDGGLLMNVLNPMTGEVINEVRFNDIDPITGESMQLRSQGSKLPTSRPDVLSVKNGKIFMGSQKIDLDGNRMWPETNNAKPGEKGLTYNQSDQGGDDVHLFSLSGFLDDSWFHRTYWIYGNGPGGGWGGWMKPMQLAPSGRILAMDDDTVYGFGRKPVFIRQSSVTEYQIFATKKGQFSKEKERAFRGEKPALIMSPEQASTLEKFKQTAIEARRKYGDKKAPEVKKASKAYSDYRTKMNQLPANKKSTENYRANNPNIADWKASLKFDDSRSVLYKYDWREIEPEIMVRAIAIANDKLIVAGPADILDEASLYGQFTAEKNQAKLEEQEAAFNGERGGHLWVMDKKSGSHVTKLELNSVPVFDGMAVSHGNILLSQKNGELVFFGE